MSTEIYLKTFQEWLELAKSRPEELRKIKQSAWEEASAFLTLARAFSNLDNYAQGVIYKGMLRLIAEKAGKLDSNLDQRSVIASVLVLVSEIKRRTEG